MLNRRRFVKSTAAAGLAAALPIPARATPHSFHLNYAPHAGHFEHSAGPAIVDQIDFAADAGFTAWEDNDMRGRDIPEQEEIAAALARNGMQMGVFVAADIAWEEPGMTTGDEASRSRFLSDIRGSIDVAKHVDATWMTVVPGHVNPRIQPHYQMANVVESLRQASEILEPHEIAYFQVGDVPGRNEPTTGEINYRRIFEHIHGKGFAGVLGMEHGKSMEGIAGEEALIEAYRQCDDF